MQRGEYLKGRDLAERQMWRKARGTLKGGNIALAFVVGQIVLLERLQSLPSAVFARGPSTGKSASPVRLFREQVENVHGSPRPSA